MRALAQSSITAVLLVAALAGGYLARDYLSDEPIAAETGLKAGAKPVEQDQMRPDMVLNDHTGQPRSLTEWDGQLVMVNFWATWCAPCRREIPMLIALQSEFSEQGLQVVGIAIDEPVPVAQYMQEVGINYPVLVGEQPAIDAAEAYGAAVTALPLTAIVDRSGRVAQVYLGELHREQALEMLDKLEPGFANTLQK